VQGQVEGRAAQSAAYLLCPTCRQRDYEKRKWTRPHAVEALARDLGTSKVQSIIEREVWAALQLLGITEKPPPQAPRRASDEAKPTRAGAVVLITVARLDALLARGT
jgi:hypothetical protein